MKDLPFCAISETGNGQKAWEIIEVQEPDLIISGNKMPGMSGFQLAKKVKAEGSPHKNIPFIFSSGAAGPYQETIKKLGAVNFPKPYPIADLKETVRELLS